MKNELEHGNNTRHHHSIKTRQVYTQYSIKNISAIDTIASDRQKCITTPQVSTAKQTEQRKWDETYVFDTPFCSIPEPQNRCEADIPSPGTQSLESSYARFKGLFDSWPFDSIRSIRSFALYCTGHQPLRFKTIPTKHLNSLHLTPEIIVPREGRSGHAITLPRVPHWGIYGPSPPWGSSLPASAKPLD